VPAKAAGDQLGSDPCAPDVFTSPDPSEFITQTAGNPDRSDVKAIRVPSGDPSGELSVDALWLMFVKPSPFEFTVPISQLPFRKAMKAMWSPSGATRADSASTPTGLLHALVAMDMPGPGTVFLSQNWKFTAPVFIGDTITATAKVVSVHESKPVTQLAVEVVRDGDEVVLEGGGVVLYVLA
jgi:hypothetical protein